MIIVLRSIAHTPSDAIRVHSMKQSAPTTRTTQPTANPSCAISKSLCDTQRSTNGKTEQIKAIKVNALLFESGKRCSIPARVPVRRDSSKDQIGDQ
jgi:hypothetical protein